MNGPSITATSPQAGLTVLSPVSNLVEPLDTTLSPRSYAVEWLNAQGRDVADEVLGVEMADTWHDVRRIVETWGGCVLVDDGTADDDYHLDMTRIVVEPSGGWREVEIAAASSAVRTCTLVDSDSGSDLYAELIENIEEPEPRPRTFRLVPTAPGSTDFVLELTTDIETPETPAGSELRETR